MGAKRFFDNSESDPDQPNGKRMKRRPSFASVISEVIMTNFLQNFCSALEPMLRKVVNEEVENGLRRGAKSLSRSTSLLIRAPHQETPSLQLMFSKKLSLPIFTGSKILDSDCSALQIVLVDTSGNQYVPTSLPYPIKIEIIVIDGDFPSNDRDTWTSIEFDKNIVRERTGKRPLLAGETQVTLRDGSVVIGDIEFTDNSSWIRCRRFRLGARMVQSGKQCVRVRETITEAFIVKDHRGELYKKHYPPALDDEVWRLEKIGKDGAFHRKLSSAGINTVQDFLKWLTVERPKLRKILGVGMSEKIWEVTTNHARTCEMGNKLYMHREPNLTIVLNPICQVVKAVINGQICSTRDLTTVNRGFIENLVRRAFSNWDSLVEVDGYVDEMPLLTQGGVAEEYPTPHQSMVRSYQQHAFLTDGSTNVEASLLSNSHTEYSTEWLLNPPVLFTSSISGSSSDVKTFFDGN